MTLKKVNNLNLYNEKNDLFELALILLGGCHGLHDHNRKYIYDSLKEKFLPIYYDGMLFYDKSNNLCEQYRFENEIDISETTH